MVIIILRIKNIIIIVYVYYIQSEMPEIGMGGKIIF